MRSLLITLLLLGTPAAADIESAWTVTTKVGPDAAVPGWFLNLGITGARAKITKDDPRALQVTHVFDRTPAHKQLLVGDRIVGSFGERWENSHRFGYGMEVFGYFGPIQFCGDAIEKALAGDGKLELLVERDGEQREVTLKLPAKIGSYAEGFPFECDKSKAVLAQLYAELLERQQDNGLWHGRPHINAFAMLALLSSEKRDHQRAAEKAAKAMAKLTQREVDWNGHSCWRQTLYGVALAEYHLKTRERWVLQELDDIANWLADAESPRGGWGHAPWRQDGQNGYGPICMITGQAMLALGLIAECGVEIDEDVHGRAAAFLAKGTNSQGYVWYKDGNGGAGYADMGRTGISALAHATSPLEPEAYRKVALRNAACIGTHPDTYPDTHACPLIGVAWATLGAGLEEQHLRNLLDENRWYFALSRTPEGHFYYQPNRDNTAQDYGAAPRLSAIATFALIFAMQHRALRITGAE
ncbi:MAG: DUF6288 domain-containing protein [Planctomycetota bacterium]|nr:DUF6288 domain-containing protein [Planctomycetota bacterium]